MGNGDVSQTQAGFNCSLQDPKSGVLALAEVAFCVACGCDARAPVAERRRPDSLWVPETRPWSLTCRDAGRC